MSSCVYECHVMHQRFHPRKHRFVYRLFMLALDLDELPALHRRLRFFSVNRANLFSLREDDYLPTYLPRHPEPAPTDTDRRGPGMLKARVVAFLADRGIDLSGGRVLLVTLPRMFGYVFKPVSFYFCFDRSGAPAAAITEVTNTFHELKPYLLGPETFARSAADTFQWRVPKEFYVSPFSAVDVAFDFRLPVPGERLAIQIDDYEGGQRSLTSTLAGPRRPLHDRALLSYVCKYPLLTLRIILLIHWHAWLLWRKRVPWFAKAARAAEQRDLFKPHHSLRPAAPDPSPLA